MLRIFFALFWIVLSAIFVGVFSPHAIGSVSIGFVVSLLSLALGGGFLVWAFRLAWLLRTHVRGDKRYHRIRPSEAAQTGYATDESAQSEMARVPVHREWRSKAAALDQNRNSRNRSSRYADHRAERLEKGPNVAYAYVGILIILAIAISVPVLRWTMAPPTRSGSASVAAVAAVGRSLSSNVFGIEQSDLRSIPNPLGAGSFVYVPETRYRGVERRFVWFVNDGVVAKLNGATDMLTPTQPFPQDAPYAIWRDSNLAASNATQTGVETAYSRNVASREATPTRPEAPMRRPSIAACAPQTFGDWTYDCTRLLAKAEERKQGYSTKQFLLTFDGNELRVSGVVSWSDYQKFYTNTPPTLATINNVPYVADPALFDQSYPAKLRVGTADVPLEWDEAPHWKVGVEAVPSTIKAIQAVVAVRLTYSPNTEGGAAIVIPVSNFSSGLRAMGNGQQPAINFPIR